MATAATLAVGFIGNRLASRDQRRATNAVVAGQQSAANEQRRQSDIARSDLSPFLRAATGAETLDTNAFLRAQQDFIKQKEAITNDFSLTTEERIAKSQALGDGPEKLDFVRGGALEELQSGLNNAPKAPELQQFGKEAIASPELQQFQQSNQLQQFDVNAPQLNNFNFDVNEALNSPELQFQRQQGEKQLDRISGQNRQLNSGNRLIDAVKFGQGLATQSINDQFNRQNITTNQNNQVNQQNFGNLGTISQLQNRIVGQNNQINQNDTALQNQNLIQQQELDRQNLSDTLNLSNVNQNRLLQQFGLEDARFNNRLDRLSGIVNVGSRTGSTLSNIGANSANNIGNILQAQGATNAAGRLGQSNLRNNLLTQGLQFATQQGLFNQTPVTQQTTQFGTIPNSQQTNLLLQQQQGF